jgi:hypothetical protein
LQNNKLAQQFRRLQFSDWFESYGTPLAVMYLKGRSRYVLLRLLCHLCASWCWLIVAVVPFVMGDGLGDLLGRELAVAFVMKHVACDGCGSLTL